jgi:hypothetical protein
MTSVSVKVVNIAARVDDEGASMRKDLDAESVVMAVRTPAACPDIVCVRVHVKIAVTHYVCTRIGK